MEFIKAKDRKGVLYIAEESSAQIQINGLKEKIAEFLNDPLLRTLEMRDWEQLGYLARNMPEDRFYLIIDEFSYLVRSDGRMLSVLQKLWDTKFSSSSIFIAYGYTKPAEIGNFIGMETRGIYLCNLVVTK